MGDKNNLLYKIGTNDLFTLISYSSSINFEKFLQELNFKNNFLGEFYVLNKVSLGSGCALPLKILGTLFASFYFYNELWYTRTFHVLEEKGNLAIV